jgi:outer membrane protein assembly factor BamB
MPNGGADRSGIFPAAELLQQWPDEGPEVILKVGDLGKGYSTPVLDDQTIYVTGKENEHDHLYAIEMDGNIKYKLDYGQSWERSYSDTRSTPTIVDGNLYLISGMGEVVCVNKEDGTIIWKVNAHEQYQGEFHKWEWQNRRWLSTTWWFTPMVVMSPLLWRLTE